MALSRVLGIESSPPFNQLDPLSAQADLKVTLEDGSFSRFVAATPDQPGPWLKRQGSDFSFGTAVLFMRSLAEEAVAEAVGAMHAEMGGYWLRYYNSAGDRSAVARTLSAVRPLRKPGVAVPVASTELGPIDQGQGQERCGVVQVRLKDGRQFSLLSATPGWFAAVFQDLGLRCYFGPAILFLRKLDLTCARKAVKAMASEGERWLCLHDTPRRCLPEVLADFKARHA